MRKNKLHKFLVFGDESFIAKNSTRPVKSAERATNPSKCNSRSSLLRSDSGCSTRKLISPKSVLKNGGSFLNLDRMTPTTAKTHISFSNKSGKSLKLGAFEEKNTASNMNITHFSMENKLVNGLLQECLVETNKLQNDMIKVIQDKIREIDMLEANIAKFRRMVKINIAAIESNSRIKSKEKREIKKIKSGRTKETNISPVLLSGLKSGIEKDLISLKDISIENEQIVNSIEIIKEENSQIKSYIKCLRNDNLYLTNENKETKTKINLYDLHIKTLRTKIINNIDTSEKISNKIKTQIQDNRNKYIPRSPIPQRKAPSGMKRSCSTNPKIKHHSKSSCNENLYFS